MSPILNKFQVCIFAAKIIRPIGFFFRKNILRNSFQTHFASLLCITIANFFFVMQKKTFYLLVDDLDHLVVHAQ